MSQPATATLVDAARRLVETRARAAELKAALARRSEIFAAGNAWLMEDKRTADDAVTAAESDVRALATAQYASTGNKKPLPGIEIKVYDVLKYDAAQAFAWAQQKGMALVPECLDVRAFDAIAKATTLPFVSHVEDARVTLGKVIEVPDAPNATEIVALDEIFGGAN